MRKFLSDVLINCDLTVSGSTSLGAATGVTVASSDSSNKLATTAWVKGLGISTSDTTYLLDVPANTTDFRLIGSDSSTDTITLSAAGASSMTRVSASELRITSIDSIDYVSNIELNGSSLDFTGVGNAFAESIELATLDIAPIQSVSGNGTTITTVYDGDTGEVFVTPIFNNTIAETGTALVTSGTIWTYINDSTLDIAPIQTVLGDGVSISTSTDTDTGQVNIGPIVNNLPTQNSGALVKSGGIWSYIDSLVYDNYQSWNLKTNSVQRTTVSSGGTLDIVAGSNVSVAYSAGGVVTISSTGSSETDTLQSVTDRGNTTTNSIGIGTTSPRTKLHVTDTITTETSIYLQRYTPAWTNNPTTNILDNNWASTLGDYLILRAAGNQNTQEAIALTKGQGVYFGITSTTGSLENDITAPFSSANHAKIGATSWFAGNVGIGTTNPSAKLHVAGNVLIGTNGLDETDTPPADFADLHIHTLTDGTPIAQDDAASLVISTGANNTGVQGWNGTLWFGNSDYPAAGDVNNESGTQFNWKLAGIGSYASTDTGSSNLGSGDLRFFTTSEESSPTERMIITRGGDVGIGTANPGSKLHVKGEIRVDFNNTDGSAYLTGYGVEFERGTNYLRPRGADGTQTLFIGGANDSLDWDTVNIKTGTFIIRGNGADRFNIGSDVAIVGSTDFNITGTSRRVSFTAGTGTIRTTTDNSLFLATNNTTAITVDSSQNVGIGTTSPDEKLHVAGKIALQDSGVTMFSGTATGDPVPVVIETFNAAQNIGAFLDFTIFDEEKGNMRSGTLQLVFNADQVMFNEVNTMDIGDTTPCTLDAVNNAGTIDVRFTAPSPTFYIKYQIRTL